MTTEPSKTKSTMTSLAAEVGLVPPDKARRGDEMAREAAEHEAAMREAKKDGDRGSDALSPGGVTNMPPD